jgi:peptidoglycan/LPS O-acetylase OafA/YrhL
LGTVLILACSREGLWTYRLMAWRPVVQVGVMSYGFYLWHQPLFAYLLAYLRHAQLGAEVPGWQFGLAGVLAYGLAVLSYWFIEQPLRNSRVLGTWGVLGLSLAVLAILYAIGWALTQDWAKAASRPAAAYAFQDFEIDNQALKAASWQALRRWRVLAPR